MTLIGLSGLKGSGKDTVADVLVEEFGWVKVGMSDALHEYLSVLNPRIDGTFTYNDLVNEYGYVEAKTNPEVRRLLQVFGTDIFRDMVDENFWVNKTREKVQGFLDRGIDVVVTGIRFPNEADMIKTLGGALVEVIRSSDMKDTHPSENQMGDIPMNWYVLNTGSLEMLKFQARGLVEWVQYL